MYAVANPGIRHVSSCTEQRTRATLGHLADGGISERDFSTEFTLSAAEWARNDGKKVPLKCTCRLMLSRNRAGDSDAKELPGDGRTDNPYCAECEIKTPAGGIRGLQITSECSHPAFPQAIGMASMTITEQEISIVCAASVAPFGAEPESGWRAHYAGGPIACGLTGVVASLVDPLAASKLPGSSSPHSMAISCLYAANPCCWRWNYWRRWGIRSFSGAESVKVDRRSKIDRRSIWSGGPQCRIWPFGP